MGDADNIDRFDAYRIYETLEYLKFSEMSLEDKREKVVSTIDRLTQYKEMKLGTATAKNLWEQRLDYYIGFYEKLKAQLEISNTMYDNSPSIFQPFQLVYPYTRLREMCHDCVLHHCVV